MAIIKKFRIKSFKKIDTIIEFENVSLAYGNRLILDNISFKINKNSLSADVIEVNIETKDLKIFMYEEDKKINFKRMN